MTALQSCSIILLYLIFYFLSMSGNYIVVGFSEILLADLKDYTDFIEVDGDNKLVKFYLK